MISETALVEPQTVLFPAIRTPVARARREPGPRARLAATVGVVVVGVASMSTAVFQTVVDSSTTLPMPSAAGAPPAAHAAHAAHAAGPGR